MDTPSNAPRDAPDQGSNRRQRKSKNWRSEKKGGSSQLKLALNSANSIVENLSSPRDDDVILTFQNYFTTRKPFLLFMDFHSLRLTKRKRHSKKTRDACFRCSACDVFLASFDDISVHVQSRSHLCNLRASWCLYVILNLDPMSEVVQKIDESLEREVETSACTQGLLSSRREIFTRIRDVVENSLTGVVLQMVGSSYHGLGLADCDLNMCISCNDGKSIASQFASFSSLIAGAPQMFRKFEKHFCEEKKPPYLSFEWEGSQPCTILIADDHSHLLSKLIKAYGNLDDRCRKLCVLFRKWASICNIDGQSDGCWPSHAFYILVIYFLQQLSDPVLPVLHELLPTESGDYENIDSFQWKSKCTSSLAKLWIQLLTFYAYQFDAAAVIVCISQLALKQRSAAKPPWNSGKRIAIMDPYDPDRNVTRGVSNSTLYDFIMYCLRITCCYYRIPQCAEGPLFGYVRPEPKVDPVLKVPGHAEFLDVQLRVSHYIVRLIPHLDSNYLEPSSSLPTILEKLNALKSLYVNICSFNLDDFANFGVRSVPGKMKYKKYSLFLNDAQYLMNLVNLDKLSYKFSSQNFTEGENCPICCSVCMKNGHSQKSCPDMKIEPLCNVPDIDQDLIALVDEVCLNVYSISKPSQDELLKRDMIIADLQDYIITLFPEACLTLFGSSRNGFGLKNSDLDICLTFENISANSGVPVSTLVQLFKHLKKCNYISNVIHIHSAKVPIVKFHHNPSGLEGDISLYNTLAQENTKMLRCYSEIDSRVKILGYVMKKFARVCNVGDASKGSLSSYCYILMVLYFLQRCDPPVIPVLQSLPSTGESLPIRYVEGHNTYFYDDINNINQVWPLYKKNTKSPGQLWIEMLRFYTETFDIENVVISIRSSETVLKLEKCWFTNVFAIEDPFDLSHNLGSGLSRKMNLFIIKAFRNARALFTSKISPNKSSTLIDCYFNEKRLAPEEPPNDRGCLLCKSIGHRFRDCPRRHGQRGGQENEPGMDKKRPEKKAEKKATNQPSHESFSEGNRLLVSSKPPPAKTKSGGPSNSLLTTANSQPRLQQKLPIPPANSGRAHQDAQKQSYRMFINSLPPRK